MRYADVSAPSVPGVYVFYDSEGACLYVGSAVNMRRRCQGHKHLSAASRAEYKECAIEDLVLRERELILDLKPKLNSIASRSMKSASASPTELISIRIPNEILSALRKESLEIERSVSWLIVRKLARTANAAVPLASTPLEAQKTKVGDSGASKTPGHHPRCKCSICAPVKNAS